MDVIDSLTGVGEKKVGLFHKLNIYTIYDLVTYYPRDYVLIKRSNEFEMVDGEKIILDGKVDGAVIMNRGNSLKKISFRFVTECKLYHVIAFNQVYLSRVLRPGMDVILFGKYHRGQDVIIVSEVRIGKLGASRMEAIYRLTSGISNHYLSKVISNAFLTSFDVMDCIPDYLISKYHFSMKRDCLYEIHFPSGTLPFKKALQRLKYEELFFYLFRIQLMKRYRDGEGGIVREISLSKVEEFINGLKFSLTEDQKSCVYEIYEDLTCSRRMNRLVQGDVGSGKTIVSFISAYMNCLAGYQTALMVPTEILANQHYQEAVDLFSCYDMEIVLLTSSVKGAVKNKILRLIESGKASMVIGTQSLIQEGVVFSNLGLIITDEQHRFGVNQRQNLYYKGVVPDVLSMSATPIPRTYALTIYGDTDVSNIRTKPMGRKEIITYYKQEKEVMDVLYLIKRELDLGHQVYVVVPAVEGDSKSYSNISSIEEKMKRAFSKFARVESIYGKKELREKSRIMKEFSDGDIDILISTTVIEVGVNVPNASMIVIFHANYFGLSTLHQLRGRVGRGDIQSYCVLLSDGYFERLNFLTTTSDGFKISEYDFQSRGEGDLFGLRQSGEIGLKLADVKRDYPLLVRVRDDVLEFMDCYSNCEKYSYLVELHEKFKICD